MAAKEPPFLPDTPPPWLARSLATSVLVVAAVAVVAGLVITVPETITGSFMLVPRRGTDPVRAPREGIVSRVMVSEAAPVARNAPLFLVSSDPARDRGADRQALEAVVAYAPLARADLDRQLQSVRDGDATERQRLDGRIATLTASVANKRRQLDIARDLESRAQQGMAGGVATASELANLRLSASRTEDELALAQGDLEEAQLLRARLTLDAANRLADLSERRRKLELELSQAAAKLDALRASVEVRAGTFEVRSPCDGVVLRLLVRAQGAVVAQGEPLATIACSGDSLMAVVQVPAQGVARVRAGQSVRLLYDAFPYQRHGVRFGVVDWVGASGAMPGTPDSSGFRARVTPDDAGLKIDGVYQPFAAGMGGTARIVVSRRRLVSYAFEPLAQLRESAAERH